MLRLCRRLATLTLALTLAATLAHGQDADADAAADPGPDGDFAEAAADAERDPALETRRAAAHALDFLLRRADEHLHGLVVSPEIIPTYQVVEQRYREKTYTAKVPIYAYEDVELLRPIGTGSARRMVKRTERRAVRITGYQDEERSTLVKDPDGPIVRQARVAVYASEDLFRGVGMGPGYLGFNAMALHTLLALGMDPADARLQRLVATLVTYVRVFGMPDATFDVAWLTAGLCAWPERSATLDELRLALLQKLLAGQIRSDVPITGLWGAACLDYEAIAAACRALQQLYTELEPLNAELQRARKQKDAAAASRAQARIDVAAGRITAYLERLRLLTRRAPYILANYRHRVTLPLPAEGELSYAGFTDQLYPLRLDTFYLDLLGENVTDLECTQWALYALAEADAHGFLPRRIPRPELPGVKGLEPYDTAAALQAAFQGVGNCYDRGAAGWRMGIQWVDTRSRYFRGVDHLPALEPASLQDRTSPVADAAAYQCLLALDRIVGLQELYRDADKIEGAISSRLQAQMEALAAMQGYGTVVGRDARNAYAYVESLAGFQWGLGERRLLRPEHAETLSAWLQANQRADGSWGRRTRTTQVDNTSFGIDSMAVRALHATRYEAEQRAAGRERTWTHHVRVKVDGPETETLCALRFLAAGAWPAVLAQWQGPGLTADSRSLARTLRELNRRGSSLSYVSTTEWPPPYIPDTPSAVLLGGSRALTADQQTALAPLRTYVQHGGLLLLECTPDAGGAAFADSVATALGAALPPDGRVALPADSPLLQGLDDAPTLQAYLGHDGMAAALLLPVGEGGLSTRTAGRVAAAAIRSRLPPLLLDPAFPILDDTGTPFNFPEPAAEADEGP